MAATSESDEEEKVIQTIGIRNLVNAIIKNDDKNVKEIILRAKMNINDLHINPDKYVFFIESNPVVNYIIKKDLIKIFNVFIECGLDLKNIEMMNNYFEIAIYNNKIHFLTFLIQKIGKLQIHNMIYKEYENRDMNILELVLSRGTIQMLHLIVLEDINMNLPIPLEDGLKVYPLCIAVFRRYGNEPIVKYLLNLPDFKYFVPNCNVGSHDEIFSDKNSSMIVGSLDNPEIIKLISIAHLNATASEITLERRVYLTMFINDIDPSNIPNYIKSANYEWLMTSDNPSPLVKQAQQKLSDYLDYLDRKRQREESTE